jgi:hypothetical protein
MLRWCIHYTCFGVGFDGAWNDVLADVAGKYLVASTILVFKNIVVSCSSDNFIAPHLHVSLLYPLHYNEIMCYC